MKAKLYTLAALLVAAALIVACGGAKKPAAQTPAASVSESTSAEATEPKAEAPTEPSDAAVATSVATAEAPESVTTSEADLSLENRASGLDQLKSYRVRWIAQWRGTDSDGKEQSDRWDWTEEYSVGTPAQPPARHWSWVSGSETEPSRTELWNIGDTMYMLGNDPESCTSLSSDSTDDSLSQSAFNPSMLGSVTNAKYVGSEMVNGVATKHYRYDEKGASLLGFSKFNGETWVAVDGGYVVKDVLNWEGGAGLFGVSMTNGSGSWNWELTDINQPVKIEPPANCGGGAALDLPVMADAKEKARFGDVLSYKTASNPTEVADFYRREMVAAGWSLDGEPTVAEQLTMLAFTKESQKAQVMLSAEDAGTTVVITVTKE
jgi:hypothetical protein